MIVSTTLTGSNQDIILGALYSVYEEVDRMLVVDTGAKDATIEIVKTTFGDKCVVADYLWKNDFSDARNFALNEAAIIGGTYAVTVDTDERIDWNGDSVKEFIRLNPDIETIGIKEKSGTYGKERVFKLPASQKFYGPTHECYLGYLTRKAEFAKARFWEVPKSPEKLDVKFKRDIEILEPYVQEHPDDPRWWYYLGESYKNTGKYEDAIVNYGKCFELNGWNEESAWSCFRIAECMCILSRFSEAKDVAIDGLKRHPGCAELHWLAGWALYQMGRYEHALAHAKYAIAGGSFEGFQREVKRIGFRHVPALHESPFDLAKWCYKMLGNLDMYQRYDEIMKLAIIARNE